MKTIIFLFGMVILGLTGFSQTTYVTSDARQTCYWDESLQKFSHCGELETFECLFSLNADETMFIHTTPKMKSTYYIKNKSYNAEADAYTYEVISDVGNKYQFILGKTSENFVILSTGHADSKDDYIMKFPIKKKWND